MPYSKSRLESVIRTFREEERKANKGKTQTRRYERSLRSKRSLRSSFSSGVEAYRDESNSDDQEYSPGKKKRKSNASGTPRTRRAKRKAQDELSSPENKKPKSPSELECSFQDENVHVPLEFAPQQDRRIFQEVDELHGFQDKISQMSSENEFSGMCRSSGATFDSSSIKTDVHSKFSLHDHDSLEYPGERYCGVGNANEDQPADYCDSVSEPFTGSGCGVFLDSARKSFVPNTKGGQSCDTCWEDELERDVSITGREFNLDNQEVGQLPTSLKELSLEPSVESTSSLALGQSDGRGTSIDDPIILSDSSAPPSPQFRPLDTPQVSTLDKKSATTFEIATSWSHPINFQYLRNPCDFCSDFRFGVVGLGVMKTRVRVKDDGRGYEEISGGHRSKGRKATKMCVACALDRLLITRCAAHMVEPIPGHNTFKKSDVSIYINELSGKSKEKSASPSHPVCSLCWGLASWRCCSKQSTDKYLNPQPQNGGLMGCGLLMCCACKSAIVINKGVLAERRLVNLRHKQGVDLPLRADVEFLFPGSLLRKSYGEK